ncbi:methyltransferase domain-containing protein [Haloferula chungangensis]|uniref:Methyltransferase domain-containing protein n=1 Tax=Haloferula chungangensis TaxID=1048331 RepID=A0ABW2L4C3_9BACT
MTDWDERWREGDTPWDHGEAAPPLLELLDSEYGDHLKGRRVLVPGCGSGEDVRALARAGARATGLDISPAATAHARQLDPTEGAEFVSGSFFDWSSEAFDAIWEHTCFCAIDPADRVRYAAACARLIRPGGFLTGVFYLEPWLPDELPEPPPYGAERSEIIDLLEPEFVLRWDKVPDRAFPSRVGREWLAVFERIDCDRGVAD